MEVVESVMRYSRDIGNITFATVVSEVMYGLPYLQELINSVLFVDNPNYHTKYQVTSMELEPISKLSTASVNMQSIITTSASVTSTMTTNVFTKPHMTSTPFCRDDTGIFGLMPTPISYNNLCREEDYSPRISIEDAYRVPEKQLVELIGEMFNNCMDNYMASRDVQLTKIKPSVSFSEVPLEYIDEPDRRVDME